MPKREPTYRPVLFNIFVIIEPLIYFCVCHGTPLTKILKTRITCKKFKYFVIRHFNKQTVIITEVKKQEINDSVVLAFLECSCYIQNLVTRQKEPVSQCVVSFSNFGNWISFGPLWRRFLLGYIWTTLLITVHTFAAVIISLHIRKSAILLHLAWLNGKKLGFTLFLLYSHKSWTAAVVYDSTRLRLSVATGVSLINIFKNCPKLHK